MLARRQTVACWSSLVLEASWPTIARWQGAHLVTNAITPLHWLSFSAQVAEKTWQTPDMLSPWSCIAESSLNNRNRQVIGLLQGQPDFPRCAGHTTRRRERDSNPRYAFTHTRFPSVRLKPLGHLSSTKPATVGGRSIPP
jgi:hypothetical protein